MSTVRDNMLRDDHKLSGYDDSVSYADYMSRRTDNMCGCTDRMSSSRDRMSDGCNQMSVHIYSLPADMPYNDWSELWADYDCGVYRGRNSEPYCHGGMSGDRCAGTHCYKKADSKNAITCGTEQSLEYAT